MQASEVRYSSIAAKKADVNLGLLRAKSGPRDDCGAMPNESVSALGARASVVDFVTKLRDHGVPQHEQPRSFGSK
jgi:hypothetical protein